MPNKFLIGADPEMFLVDAANSLVSCIGLIGGTKDNPRPLQDLGPGFAVQEDNVAVEFNIPAASSAQQFSGNLARAVSYLSDEVAKHQLKFINLSAAIFPEEQLKDPRALEFGCDPDFNAWKGGMRNPRPKASDERLRSCGGHVHIGYEFKDRLEIIQFIKFLDLYLSVPSTIMDNGELRKQLYGKAGAFRFKPYGCEYRSLSNYWVMENKGEWVYNQVDAAMDAWHNNEKAVDEDRALILAAINDNNKDIAHKLVDKYSLQLA